MPKELYWIIGVLVLFNSGTIFTVLVASGKGIWWASKVDSKVEAAHNRLDSHHKAIERVEADLEKVRDKVDRLETKLEDS